MVDKVNQGGSGIQQSTLDGRNCSQDSLSGDEFESTDNWATLGKNDSDLVIDTDSHSEPDNSPKVGLSKSSRLLAPSKPHSAKRRRKALAPKSFVKESDMQRPINKKGSPIRVGLVNRTLWGSFSALTTEMLVNKRGRRMFPSIDILISGLDPVLTYTLAVDVVALDKWRYKFLNGKWVASRPSSCSHFVDCFVHPSSPASGREWMERDVSFGSLKLTNSVSLDDDFVRVATMHHYQPRLHIIEGSAPKDLPPDRTHTFLLPSTDFFPVTSYMNERIIDLKIQHNKYAKGFQASRESKKQRTVSCSSLQSESLSCPFSPGQLNTVTTGDYDITAICHQDSQSDVRIPAEPSPLHSPVDNGGSVLGSRSGASTHGIDHNGFMMTNLLSRRPHTSSSHRTEDVRPVHLPPSAPHPMPAPHHGYTATSSHGLRSPTELRHSEELGMLPRPNRSDELCSATPPLSPLSSPLSAPTCVTSNTYPPPSAAASVHVLDGHIEAGYRQTCPSSCAASVHPVQRTVGDAASIQSPSWAPVYFTGFRHQFGNSQSTFERASVQSQTQISPQMVTSPGATISSTPNVPVGHPAYPVPLPTPYIPAIPNPFVPHGNGSNMRGWNPFVVSQVPSVSSTNGGVPTRNANPCNSATFQQSMANQMEIGTSPIGLAQQPQRISGGLPTLPTTSHETNSRLNISTSPRGNAAALASPRNTFAPQSGENLVLHHPSPGLHNLHGLRSMPLWVMPHKQQYS